MLMVVYMHRYLEVCSECRLFHIAHGHARLRQPVRVDANRSCDIKPPADELIQHAISIWGGSGGIDRPCSPCKEGKERLHGVQPFSTFRQEVRSFSVRRWKGKAALQGEETLEALVRIAPELPLPSACRTRTWVLRTADAGFGLPYGKAVVA